MKILKRIILTLVVIALSLGLTTFIAMQQNSFGKLPSGKRLDRIKQSPNYRDGSFQNIYKTEMMAEGVSYPKMMLEFFGKGVDREPTTLLPSVKTDLKSITTIEPLIIWFGHSSYLIMKALKQPSRWRLRMSMMCHTACAAAAATPSRNTLPSPSARPSTAHATRCTA